MILLTGWFVMMGISGYLTGLADVPAAGAADQTFAAGARENVDSGADALFQGRDVGDDADELAVLL